MSAMWRRSAPRCHLKHERRQHERSNSRLVGKRAMAATLPVESARFDSPAYRRTSDFKPSPEDTLCRLAGTCMPSLHSSVTRVLLAIPDSIGQWRANNEIIKAIAVDVASSADRRPAAVDSIHSEERQPLSDEVCAVNRCWQRRATEDDIALACVDLPIARGISLVGSNHQIIEAIPIDISHIADRPTAAIAGVGTKQRRARASQIRQRVRALIHDDEV